MTARDAALPRRPKMGEDPTGTDAGACCGHSPGSGTWWHMSCFVPRAIAVLLGSGSALLMQPLALERQSLNFSRVTARLSKAAKKRIEKLLCSPSARSG